MMKKGRVVRIYIRPFPLSLRHIPPPSLLMRHNHPLFYTMRFMRKVLAIALLLDAPSYNHTYTTQLQHYVLVFTKHRSSVNQDI